MSFSPSHISLDVASRFRVKTLHQNYKAEERGYELHAGLQYQLFEWTGLDRAVEIERAVLL